MIKTLYPIFRKWSEKGSVWIISDTHFEDEDCKLMDSNWLDANDFAERISKLIGKYDTLIHLGDVGNPKYIERIKGYKILILGNHDFTATKFQPYFNEIYTGPLFIADKILLSHEPIFGLPWCLNIHGHDHSGRTTGRYHLNLAANVCGYTPANLGQLIKGGILAEIDNIHRYTIDNAIINKKLLNNANMFDGDWNDWNVVLNG